VILEIDLSSSMILWYSRFKPE